MPPFSKKPTNAPAMTASPMQSSGVPVTPKKTLINTFGSKSPSTTATGARKPSSALPQGPAPQKPQDLGGFTTPGGNSFPNKGRKMFGGC